MLVALRLRNKCKTVLNSQSGEMGNFTHLQSHSSTDCFFQSNQPEAAAAAFLFSSSPPSQSKQSQTECCDLVSTWSLYRDMWMAPDGRIKLITIVSLFQYLSIDFECTALLLPPECMPSERTFYTYIFISFLFTLLFIQSVLRWFTVSFLRWFASSCRWLFILRKAASVCPPSPRRAKDSNCNASWNGIHPCTFTQHKQQSAAAAAALLSEGRAAV